MQLLFVFLFLLDIHIGKNHFAASLKPKLAAVQCQMVASGIAPLFAGVIIIVACPFLICLVYHVCGLFL